MKALRFPVVFLALLSLAPCASGLEGRVPTGGDLSASDRKRMEDLRPKFSFGDKAPVAAPDYSSQSAWAALPGIKDDADKYPPNTAYPEAQSAAAADVFFIHPTTSVSSAYWNVPIDDPAAADGVSVVMATYASVFNAAAMIYAPRYRQATLYAFFDDRTDSGLKAVELAYSDVERAFGHYIKHSNQGRPFMLAGHSQGSIHGIRLLQERIIGTPLQKRLVAAYLVGGPVLRDTPGIKASRLPSDTGVLIGWTSYTREGDPDFFTRSCITWLPGGYSRVGGRPIVQVNPLSWALNGAIVPVKDNPGSLPLLIDRRSPDRMPDLIPGVCGADASGEVLIIYRPETAGFQSDSDGLSIFNTASGDFHNLDYTLFYESVRKNAMDRVHAFKRESRLR